jgi:RNA polymerase sigma factor (sigma-70 family)
MSVAASANPLGDDDPALVRRTIAGDRTAFEQLMRRHNRRLFRIARATLRDAAEAEDALQEAYLHAYRHLQQFKGDAAFSTWLSRLVLNECVGRLRRQARRNNIAPIFAPADQESLDRMGNSTLEAPDQAAMRAEVRTLLERKLDELPESFRVVFVLRSVEELTVEETAACLDLPEATVRTRHFRARSLLRESLARDLDLAERDVFEFGGSQCDRTVAAVLERLQKEEAAS